MSAETTQSGTISPGAEEPAAQPVLGAPASVPPPAAEAPVIGKAAEPAAVVTDEAKKAAEAKTAEDVKAAEAKKAEETKAADAKKAEDTKKASDKAWAEWKPKLPAGAEVVEAELKEFIPLAREAGLTPEQAQKFVEYDAKRSAAREQAGIEKLKAERDGWLKDTSKRVAEADKRPELSAEKKVAEATKMANRAFEKFAPKGFVEFLRGTGFDAHPGLFEFMQNVGAAMKDDSISGALPGDGGGVPTQEAQLRVLYPSMFKNK